MNRLWVRLSLAFCGVVFFSFFAVSVISLLIIRANAAQFDSLARVKAPNGVIPALESYYEEHQSWDGVDSFMAGVESVFQFRPNDLTTLTLLDGDGNRIYGELAVDDAKAVETVPITADDQTVAFLVVAQRPVDIHAPAPGFLGFPRLPLEPEDVLLLVIFVGSGIGILFGVLMSRTLTAPLDDLSEAAEDIGAGNLARRVQVKGTAETRSLAQSFNTMIDKLQRTETLRRSLVADVAHELRTPITALQASIYAILDDAFPMTKTEIAGLYEQTRMLSRLVQDLHELSQAEARQLPLHRIPVDFGESLPEFVAPFRPVAEGKGVRLALDVPPELPRVQVDVERINEVLHNLLNNALRHTPEGGTITIQARSSEPANLQIAVQDTGEGIAPEHLPNVFERFYRVDYGRSRQAGGTGLGLAIAKAIIEAHDGEISVSSPGIPGQGTTFTIQLPVQA
jgi:signal transduction histidine kinase